MILLDSLIKILMEAQDWDLFLRVVEKTVKYTIFRRYFITGVVSKPPVLKEGRVQSHIL